MLLYYPTKCRRRVLNCGVFFHHICELKIPSITVRLLFFGKLMPLANLRQKISQDKFSRNKPILQSPSDTARSSSCQKIVRKKSRAAQDSQNSQADAHELRIGSNHSSHERPNSSLWQGGGWQICQGDFNVPLGLHNKGLILLRYDHL